MPFDRNLYPLDWPAISRRIRFERAGGHCECTGQCGVDHNNGRRCPRKNGDIRARLETGLWIQTKVVLTVAHLQPPESDCRDENLLAMCQACHLRLDRDLHTTNSTATRRRKKDEAHEAAGQGRLL